MLLFKSIVFCIVSQALVFIIVLPTIEKVINKKINIKIRIILSLILWFTSLWIYAQRILFIRGETDQIKNNISFLIPEYFKSDHNFLNAIQLSFQYDAFFFIFNLFFSFIITLILWNYIFAKRKLFVKFLFIGFVLYSCYGIPFNIVDNHNEMIAKKEQEIVEAKNEAERAARASYNAAFLDEYKIYFMRPDRGYEPTINRDLARYSACYSRYENTNGLSCEKTKYFCKTIRSVYDVDAEYIDILKNGKLWCSIQGWDDVK